MPTKLKHNSVARL